MKKLKVWKTCWHVSHDFDLITALKGVADFSLLINYTRRWDEKNRSIPENTEWVQHFEKGKYDLAILNIDQQCNLPNLNKGILTKHMREAVGNDCPVIYINHGTPVYPEVYEDGNSKNGYVSERLKKEIKEIVKDDTMVVNSHQAVKDWGWGHCIIHGLGEEWQLGTKEPRVCTYISKAGIGDKYYNRTYLVEVMEELRDTYGIFLQWINTPQCFNAKNIKEYREFLAKSLVYFNPTFASPMPRSRTEAMLSGCCIVTTPQHGADKCIKDGENGFLVPHNNVALTAKLISTLLTEYQQAKKVGEKGRKTALKLFNYKRYKADWVKLLKEIL